MKGKPVEKMSRVAAMGKSAGALEAKPMMDMMKKKKLGMTIKGKPAPMPTKKKKKRTMAEHTRSLKAAIKY